MRLQNFEISSSIELQSGGLFWDLHNFAQFRGLEIRPAENVAVMSWTVPDTRNPWGCGANKFMGMKIRFIGLHFIRVSPRNPELPLTEDTCVSDILRVDPAIEHPELYIRAVHEVTGRFSLAIRFQSGRVFEIESDSVELVPASAGHRPEEGGS